MKGCMSCHSVKFGVRQILKMWLSSLNSEPTSATCESDYHM